MPHVEPYVGVQLKSLLDHLLGGLHDVRLDFGIGRPQPPELGIPWILRDVTEDLQEPERSPRPRIAVVIVSNGSSAPAQVARPMIQQFL